MRRTPAREWTSTPETASAIGIVSRSPSARGKTASTAMAWAERTVTWYRNASGRSGERAPQAASTIHSRPRSGRSTATRGARGTAHSAAAKDVAEREPNVATPRPRTAK